MGGKSHVVGYTATKPRNKQLLNSELPSSTHVPVPAGPAAGQPPDNLSSDLRVLSIKITLAISAGCETLASHSGASHHHRAVLICGIKQLMWDPFMQRYNLCNT